MTQLHPATPSSGTAENGALEPGANDAARNTAGGGSAEHVSEQHDNILMEFRSILGALGLAEAAPETLKPPAATLDEVIAALADCRAEDEGGDLDPQRLVMDVASALRLLLKRRSLPPVVITSVIDALADSGHWRIGVAVFKALDGLPVHLPHFQHCAVGNAALHACSHGLDTRAALEVYGLMNCPGRQQDSTTYALLLPLLLDCGDSMSSVMCFADAVLRNYSVSAVTCKSLLAALQRDGRWREVEAALVCAMPVAPFQALGDDLYWPPDPTAPFANPMLLRLQNVSLRHIEPLVAVQRPRPPRALGSQEDIQAEAQGGDGQDSEGTAVCDSTVTVLEVVPGYMRVADDSDSDADGSSDGEGEVQLVARVPLYLLGTPQALHACNMLLALYRDASPGAPQAARARSLLAAMRQAHADGFMPAPDDTSYQLLLDSHLSLGSAPEAWELLMLLSRADWQPPDDAFTALLATACGTQHESVPTVWRNFKLRGTLPEGMCCMRFVALAIAATSSVPRSATGPDDLIIRGLASRDAPEHVSDGAIARMVREAATMQAALLRAGAAEQPMGVFHNLLAAGIGVSWRTVVDCCGHVARHGQLPCCPSPPGTCSAAVGQRKDLAPQV